MSISFKQVQQNLEYYADELMALIGEDLDESRDYAESLRASLELHGACAFHELRAFHGDSRTFAYDTRVRNEMITELGRLLGALPVDPQSDGGQAAPTPREPERPPRDDRSTARLRRLDARERLLAHRGYFATRERLFTAALEVAEIHVHRGVGHFADRSQQHCDFIQVVALNAVDRCARNWRPEKSPLRAFLCAQVAFALRDAHRDAKTHNDRLAKVIASHEQAARQNVGSDELADEALLQRSKQRYADAKAQLPLSQRAELERVLEPGEKRTERERSVYRRAKRSIQRYYEQHPLD